MSLLALSSSRLVKIGSYYWDDYRLRTVEPSFTGLIFLWHPDQLKYVKVEELLYPVTVDGEIILVPYLRTFGLVRKGDISILTGMAFGCTKIFGLLVKGELYRLPYIFASMLALELTPYSRKYKQYMRHDLERLIVAVPVSNRPINITIEVEEKRYNIERGDVTNLFLRLLEEYKRIYGLEGRLDIKKLNLDFYKQNIIYL